MTDVIIDKAKFSIVSIVECPTLLSGSVLYSVEVKGSVNDIDYNKTHECEFRPNIEYRMSNKAIPTDFIILHIESKIRKDFENKSIIIKEIELI